MAMQAREAVRLLREAYEAKGYIRVKMDKRQGGKRTGWEIRLRAINAKQARQWSQALSAIRLEAGLPYARGINTVVPLYGREQVQIFLRQVKPRTKFEIPQLPASTDMRRSRHVSGARSRSR